MGMISDKSVALLGQLNRETWLQVAGDSRIPQTLKTFLYFHLTYPWVHNFAGIAISPLNPGLDGFLGRPVFDLNGMTFYFPSQDWWTAHAERSHGPGGGGCDVGVHVDFLTVDGGNAEFAYAIVLKNGDVIIAAQADFENECSFWSASKE